MSEFVKEVTDSNFESEVLQAGRPVLVDFWAPWCAPCRMIAPTVEAIAQEYEGSATVTKLNVDENPSISQRFGIKGIPTMILFKDGREAERMVGAGSKEALSRLIDRHTTTKAA
jgi:thioredoxin 1